MELDRTQHPCFNENAKLRFGRIHLAVAPKCNIQCNFCDRRYDCVNDNRPGVTSAVLTPKQALAYLRQMVERKPNLSVVGIAGPGDPFANPDETLETMRLVRQEFPSMLLCVASNGLNVAPYAQDLANLNVTHLTLTINAVDPDIGQKIYAWVRDGKKIYRDRAAAEVLLSRQLESLRLCSSKGVTTKVNYILIPGVNDHHIADAARTVSEQGASLFNCIGMCHVPETPFAQIPSPGKETVESARKLAEVYLPQMRHCTRCRADAVGCLGDAVDVKAMEIMRQIVFGAEAAPQRPYVAVTTQEGFLINQHLGHAREFVVYGCENGRLKLIETRPAPDAGGGDQRWADMAAVLKDCQAVFTSLAGQAPVNALADAGIKVIQTEGLIEQVIVNYFDGKMPKPVRKPAGCQGGCAKSNAGAGCG
jgi:nitrogen fixation protein NifB